MRSFWNGKRVLLTGHTGFKGAWLGMWLERLGATIAGISLEPVNKPNLFDLIKSESKITSFFHDIRDINGIASIVRQFEPEIIFHLAAQALVRESYKEPIDTFSTNIMGTVNLLQAIRGVSSVKSAVLITTDKVYQNHELQIPFKETDALGGHDPYSASKAASEIAIDCFRMSFLNENNTAVASARAGNVIGGGDWSNDRLMPDAIRAWQSGSDFIVRRPDAVRPWQHVLEPLAGYITLAQQLWAHPELEGAYNFGPSLHGDAAVRHVVERANRAMGHGKTIFQTYIQGPHEASCLRLDTSKSRNLLNVCPKWTLDQAVDRTVAWYVAQSKGADARRLCYDDIAAFEGLQ